MQNIKTERNSVEKKEKSHLSKPFLGNLLKWLIIP